MEKLKIIFFFILFLIDNQDLTAQSTFEFEHQMHDFGQIMEGQVVSHDFVYTNTGDQPLVISNVRASCGCTTPYWTKEPVLPGKSGRITASYNSKGRPGNFNKTITITANTTPPTFTLQIKGTAMNESNLASGRSPAQLALSPKIDIKEKLYQLGKVGINQTIPIQLEISNSGKSKLAIVNAVAGCKCIKIDTNTKRVYNPGESGKTQLFFSPRAIGDFKDQITIQTNDITQRRLTLNINATIVEHLGQESIVQKEKTVKF